MSSSKRKRGENARDKSTRSKKKTGKLSIQAEVRKAITREMDLKGVDVEVSGVAVDTLGTNANIHVINPVDLGTGTYRRLDREVKMKSIRIKSGLVYTYRRALITGSVPNTAVRISAIMDSKPNGVIPAWSDIFRSLSTGGGFTETIRSDLNFENTDRFTTLRDEWVMFNPNYYYKDGLLDDQCTMRAHIDWFIDLKGKKCRWGANAEDTTIADYDENVIYLVVRTTTNNTDSIMNYGVHCRLRFTDM